MHDYIYSIFLFAFWVDAQSRKLGISVGHEKQKSSPTTRLISRDWDFNCQNKIRSQLSNIFVFLKV
jgi:hypothetical protein